MKWIIIIAVIIAFFLFKARSASKEVNTARTATHGTMDIRYVQLLDYLHSTGLKTQRVTSSSIIMAAKTITCTLDYVGGNLEIRMKGEMPYIGHTDKKWIFPENYSQEKMIEEIENYFDWLDEKMTKISERTNM